MNLKHPETDLDFVVGPVFFVASFDVYDREETLGIELGKFDPNEPAQLTDLLRQHFFETPSMARYSAQHKAELLRVLKLALDSNLDFAPLFDRHATSTLSQDDYSLPWDVRNPRAFFEELYRLAREYW